jgi:hypothetical protein
MSRAPLLAVERHHIAGGFQIAFQFQDAPVTIRKLALKCCHVRRQWQEQRGMCDRLADDRRGRRGRAKIGDGRVAWGAGAVTGKATMVADRTDRGVGACVI